MPKISIIVPVYKVEQYLDRCVESILAQTFTDFELILVDDGSPDNCPQMCDEWAKKDSRIVVIHQNNGGLSAARNAGIDWSFANSDSEWLTFIDSDDWVHNEYLERLCNVSITKNVHITICEFYRTDGENPVQQEYWDNVRVYDPEEFFVSVNALPVIACCKLYKKECFLTVRYPIGKFHEDEFVTYTILFEQPHIALIQAPLYCYFNNPNSIMTTAFGTKILDRIEAKLQQIKYFERKGFIKARNCSARWLLKIISDEINKRKRCSTESQMVRYLRRQLRRYLRKYGSLNSFSIRNNPEYYEAAFPCLTYIYWTLKGIMNKFGRNK